MLPLSWSEPGTLRLPAQPSDGIAVTDGGLTPHLAVHVEVPDVRPEPPPARRLARRPRLVRLLHHCPALLCCCDD
jgi:hypothetical protein